VAVKDYGITSPTRPVAISVLDNDLNPGGGLLRILQVDPPQEGRINVGLDGVVTYTPAVDFMGAETFEYTITDGRRQATGVIEVAVGQDHPVANPDEAIANEGASVTIDVLANDGDPLGQPVAISSFDATSVEGGTVQQVAPGQLQYTPPAGNFTVNDSFTYVISDPDGLLDGAPVTIQIVVSN
jgi:hypothetical protein